MNLHPMSVEKRASIPSIVRNGHPILCKSEFACVSRPKFPCNDERSYTDFVQARLPR